MVQKHKKFWHWSHLFLGEPQKHDRDSSVEIAIVKFVVKVKWSLPHDLWIQTLGQRYPAWRHGTAWKASSWGRVEKIGVQLPTISPVVNYIRNIYPRGKDEFLHAYKNNSSRSATCTKRWGLYAYKHNFSRIATCLPHSNFWFLAPASKSMIKSYQRDMSGSGLAEQYQRW